MQIIKHFFHSEKTKKALWTILSLLIAVVFLFPLYWIVVSSLKSDAEIFSRPITLIAQKIDFSGYIQQLTGKYSILVSSINSVVIAVSAMVLSCILAIPAAYGISRFKLPGSSVIIMLFLITQMLPSSLLLTPLYLNFSRLGLLNSYIAQSLGIMTITIPFVLLILRPMFLTTPKELEEAARIDGCNRFSAFIKIVLPTVKPGIVTCVCFGFVHGWNDLIYSLTFNTDSKLYPMTAAIYNLMNEFGIRWNWIMAYGCMLVIPPALLFIFAQKYVVSGITGGAVKG